MVYRNLSRRAIVTIVAVAVLILGGVGVYLLTRDGDNGAAENAGQTSAPTTPGSSSGTAGPSSDPSPGSTAPGSGGGPGAPGDTGAAKTVAEQAVAAINAQDPEAMKKISCDPDTVGPADSAPPGVRAELVSAPEVEGDTATVEVKLSIGEDSTTTPLPLRRKDGTWCVE